MPWIERRLNAHRAEHIRHGQVPDSKVLSRVRFTVACRITAGRCLKCTYGFHTRPATRESSRSAAVTG